MPKANKELQDWQEEIEIARKARLKFLIHWNYWEQVYDDNLWGNAGFETRSRRSRQNDSGYFPQVNELESIILNIVPSIHYYAPVFELQPVDEAYRLSAQIYELLATVLYETLGMYETIEETIIDTLLLGGGLHKTGYFYEVETSEYQLGDATAGEPEIRDEMILSGWVSPIHTLWDYRVQQWGDKRWVAEEIVKPVEEVKKSSLYKNTSDLEGTIISSAGIEGISRKQERDKKGDLVRLVEIHDLANSKILTIADGHNKILRKDDDYGLELYDQLTFTPSRPKRVWGKSIAQSIEEHMISLAKSHYYLQSHGRRVGTTKLMVEPSAVSKEAAKKLESSKDVEIVPIDGITQGAPVQELKLSSVGADWYANINITEQVIRQLSGITLQERGRHEPGVETAFEASKLSEASDKRNRYRIRKLNKFTADVMTKVLRIASDNFSSARILSMVGVPEEWAYALKSFDRMNLIVKFGSTAIEARQEMLQKVMMLGQAAAQVGVQLNPSGYMKLVSEALGMEFRESMILTGEQAGAAGGGSPGQTPRSPAAGPQPRQAGGGALSGIPGQSVG